MKMSLAQALRAKAELVKEIMLTQSRITECVTYTEGHEVYSQGDYDELVTKLDKQRKNLMLLKLAVDTGNHIESDPERDSVHKLIIARGEAKADLDFTQSLRNLVVHASQPRGTDYHGNPVPQTKARMTVKNVDVQLDNLRKFIKTIDDRISDMNGKVQVAVDLLEI